MWNMEHRARSVEHGVENLIISAGTSSPRQFLTTRVVPPLEERLKIQSN